MESYNFLFVPCSQQDKTASFSFSLPSSKLTIFLILFTKHDTNNIADPSIMQDHKVSLVQ